MLITLEVCFYSQRIGRELQTCARLQHENILPLFGYTYGFGLLMAMVCPWAENGNLTTFLEREGSTLSVVRRFKIVSLPGNACKLQTDSDASSRISSLVYNTVRVSDGGPDIKL